MSTGMQLTEDRLKLVVAALLWVFPDLRFTPPQVTPEAAAYAFQAMRKLDAGSRVARGLFELVSLPLAVQKWSDIPEGLWDAFKEAMKEPGKSVKSRVGIALIVLQHLRQMQSHLDNPEAQPCPAFDQASLW